LYVPLHTTAVLLHAGGPGEGPATAGGFFGFPPFFSFFLF
jgi:hypothetical protein